MHRFMSLDVDEQLLVVNEMTVKHRLSGIYRQKINSCNIELWKYDFYDIGSKIFFKIRLLAFCYGNVLVRKCTVHFCYRFLLYTDREFSGPADFSA